METSLQNCEMIKDVLKTLKTKMNDLGASAASDYLKEQLNKWEETTVTLAVAGGPGAGKSTFINVIRGVKPGDIGYAPVGNTTTEPTLYHYPKNKKIRLCDLPVFGTVKHPKDGYCEKMKLAEYDVFLIFIDLVLREDDLWLAVTLHKMNKPFVFVRSKIDEDILYMRYTEHDKINPVNIIDDIRTGIMWDVQTNKVLQECLRIFLISGFDQEIGDWDELVSFIGDSTCTCISNFQKQAFLYALPNLKDDIVEKKYQQLESRLNWVTAGSCLVSPIPILGAAINMGIVIQEIKHYLGVFHLRREVIANLEGFKYGQLKCKAMLDPEFDFTDMITRKYFGIKSDDSAAGKGKIISDMLSRMFGTPFSISFKVHSFLTCLLQDLKEDAHLVYGHIAKTKREHLFPTDGDYKK